MSDDQPSIELTITVTNPNVTSVARRYDTNPVTGKPWTSDDLDRIVVRMARPKPIPETPPRE